MFEVGRIHEIVTAMLASNRGWREFRNDFAKDEISWWLRWTREDEIHENPFIRNRGFNPHQEAKAFLHHVLQKYVNEVAYSVQSGGKPTRKINAVNELAQLLGVPVPAATIQAHNNNPNWWLQYQTPAIPIAPPVAPQFSFGMAPQSAGSLAYEPPLHLPPPSDWPSPAPPPQSRAEGKAEKIRKLVAIISHPNTGEAERSAALAAYGRVLGEAVR